MLTWSVRLLSVILIWRIRWPVPQCDGSDFASMQPEGSDIALEWVQFDFSLAIVQPEGSDSALEPEGSDNAFETVQCDGSDFSSAVVQPEGSDFSSAVVQTTGSDSALEFVYQSTYDEYDLKGKGKGKGWRPFDAFDVKGKGKGKGPGKGKSKGPGKGKGNFKGKPVSKIVPRFISCLTCKVVFEIPSCSSYDLIDSTFRLTFLIDFTFGFLQLRDYHLHDIQVLRYSSLITLGG